jgi:ribosome-binding factor A
MADAARARKLAVRIREIVAETLRTQVKDPRLGMVTVTDAKVTADLHDATVYYTVYGDETERAATAAALESARGVLRSTVGRQTGVRFTPTLAFVLDEVPKTAKQIEDLLAEAREADAEVQRQAAGATYAGEADPYRVPNPDDDDDDDVDVDVDVDDEDNEDEAEPPADADLAGRSGR